MYDLIVIGGGAAGFFTAINSAEKVAGLKIAILEKSSNFLSKVKVSGGGRCNFTHACFDPLELSKFYPRGQKELRGPFNRFASGDTIEWFESRGIEHYTVEDGSIFPISDNSQTVIDLFISLANKYKIDLLTNRGVNNIEYNEGNWENGKVNKWKVESGKEIFLSKNIVIATGSSKPMWSLLEKLGHNIINPLPSLFTFKINDPRIDGLMGQVINPSKVSLVDSKLDSQLGPLLLTHWGMSGPAILKLSSFGARIMAESDYQFNIEVNYFPQHLQESLYELLLDLKNEIPKQQINNYKAFPIPHKLYQSILNYLNIPSHKKWADASNKELQYLASEICSGKYKVNGRYKFKDEFVTAGGVDLKQINFKRFESKLLPGLFVAGEALDIDAVTGGFNFQNAWTGAWIISESLLEDFSN